MGRFKTNNHGATRDFKPERRFNGGDFRKPRKFGLEMTSVICAKCGRSCEVPFKPKGDKPVYCRNCYNQTGSSEFSNEPSSFAPRERSEHHSDFKSGQSEELDKINRKLDKIMRALKID
jgi:CxxC-x17-CxxC domain-containing protein